MSTPIVDTSPSSTFTAALVFQDHVKNFSANRVKAQEFITSSGSYWAIKGFEDTVNPQTQSTEINTLQFYMEKHASGFIALTSPLVLPQIAANSAGYYSLQDSPDDDDDLVDTAYEFPCVTGHIYFASYPDIERLCATFTFEARNPDDTIFTIRGVFDVNGRPHPPMDLR